MSDIRELIEINKNIEKQNAEIIRLLKIIAGEGQSEETVEEEIVEQTPSKQLLNTSLGVGEVIFIDGDDIFKLSVENNENTINNLTGDGEPGNFDLAQMVANESAGKNLSLPDSTVILDKENSHNLAVTLKICVDEGAQNVYIPWSAMAQLAYAPQVIMTLLNLDFYRTEEDLLEKLFG